MATRDYTTATSKKQASKDLFSDIDITFERHPITDDIVVKKDVDAVKRAVKNICLTNHYERPFKPNFGSNLRSRLFELADGEIGTRTMQNIATSITNLEPRAQNLSFQVQQSKIDANSLNVTVFFTVGKVPGSQSVDFSVSRVR